VNLLLTTLTNRLKVLLQILSSTHYKELPIIS
jgi:hypothetical protein